MHASLTLIVIIIIITINNNIRTGCIKGKRGAFFVRSCGTADKGKRNQTVHVSVGALRRSCTTSQAHHTVPVEFPQQLIDGQTHAQRNGFSIRSPWATVPSLGTASRGALNNDGKTKDTALLNSCFS